MSVRSWRFRVATLAGAIAFVIAPLALGADVSDIGYLDQSALAAVPAFAAANRALQTSKEQLDRQFADQVRRARSPQDQQRLASDFQRRFLERRQALFGGPFRNAQVAVASVMSTKTLSVVVDKSIVIYGGHDVTRNVVDLLRGPGPPVPPVSTPPPSKVGYVDQTQIDALPKAKAASDEFEKFSRDQQADLQTKMRTAKNDAERSAILKAHQQAINDKRDQLVKPLVDQTRSVIADVARQKGLVLVVDKGDIILGGVDITSDVVNALK